ncbi:hypothetical protein HBI12_052340 [Parastagonospora nodorum]|nr:hypothetical protein HBI12_052340 [Parastagonospora nodorum]KAH6472429.1 hypothetical protein HBI59_025940 [Parastagonospora nodorum]
MRGSTLFLVASCVLPIFASPVPMEGIKARNVPVLNRRNTLSVTNLFPTIFGKRSIVEAVPNSLTDIEARGRNTPGGGLKERSVGADIEARGRNTPGGGLKERSVEADIEARGRNTPGGGLKERSVEVDIEARGRNTPGGGL